MKSVILKFILIVVWVMTIGVTMRQAHASEQILIKRKNPFRPQLPVEIEKPKIREGMIPKMNQNVKKIPEVKKSTRTFKKPVVKKKVVQKPKEIKSPELNITGLIWNSDRPQAIINNQVVDVGDTIDSARILAIRKGGIEIVVEGQRMTIHK